MTSAEVLEELAAFLKLHKVRRSEGPPIYALTPSSLAITVSRQQIRALNLAYAIHETWSNPKPISESRIAVIGGGFAGVTVAAGLLKKGFEVHLFEQRPELCHLQSGCETRWLHPSIYEWPSPNSDLADARLPLLNWYAGTAGDVARMALRQFKGISEAAGDRYHLYLRANARISGDRVQWDNAHRKSKSAVTRWLGRGGQERFDIVVLAAGFGVEKGVTSHQTTSYWRNDRYGQAQPGVRSEQIELVFVSGTGDGALIDLIRLCIQGFKHDRLIDDLFDEHPLLVEKLQDIRKNHLADLSANPKSNLLKMFSELYAERTSQLGMQVQGFVTRLRDRLRLDTRVILNGSCLSFSEILVEHKRSFLNVVLIFFLYQLDAFSYIGGSSKRLRGKHQARIVDYGDVNFDEGIFRHGTAREEVLLAAGLNIEEINTLFEEQDRLKSQFLQKLWEPGWWTVSPNAESK